MTTGSSAQHRNAWTAWLPVYILAGINVLNYIDRFVITALLPLIQADLGLNDSLGGLLGTAFILTYALTSPIFGWIGDNRPRPRWLGLGVAVWSAATAAAGLARGFASLFFARTLVGVGEAAYGTIGPSILADSFDKAKRGRVMSIFLLAIPVGSALGYLLGGVLGKHFGWRPAFFMVGLPGLFFAFAAARLRDPARGESDRDDEPHADKTDAQQSSPTPQAGNLKQTYRHLAKNRLYVGTVLGYTAYTFALGGLAFWMPSYMVRERGFDLAHGMLIFGAITVGTGIVGTLAGGWLGDKLLPVTRKAYTWLGVVGVGIGGMFTWWAILTPNRTAFITYLTIAELFLFLNTGPINALLVNCVPFAMRSTAMAVSIFVIHMWGDAISPAIIGRISDAQNLTAGIQLIPVAFFVGSAIWATTLPRRRRANAG